MFGGSEAGFFCGSYRLGKLGDGDWNDDLVMARWIDIWLEEWACFTPCKATNLFW